MTATSFAQLERSLDRTIERLTSVPSTPQVRALLIEARRLRNVIAKWQSIPPPQDVHEDMVDRVLQLSTALGGGGPEQGEPAKPAARAAPNPTARKLVPMGTQSAADAGRRTAAVRASPASPLPAIDPRGAAIELREAPAPADDEAYSLDFEPHLYSLEAETSARRLSIPRPSLVGPLDLSSAPRTPAEEPEPAPQRAQTPPRGEAARQTSPVRPDMARQTPPVRADARQTSPVRPDMARQTPPVRADARQTPPVRGRSPIDLRSEEAPESSPFAEEGGGGGRRREPPQERGREEDFSAWPMPDSLPPMQVTEAEPAPARAPAASAPPPLPVMAPPAPAVAARIKSNPPPSAADVAPYSEDVDSVPRTQIKAVAVKLAEPVNPLLVTLVDAYSPSTDAYRALRRKLTSSGDPRVIGITSAEPGEGKTVLTLNFALVLRETARGRVLVVEANLRSPSMAKMLGFEPPECFIEQLTRRLDDPRLPWVAAEPMPKLHVMAIDTQVKHEPLLNPVAFASGMDRLKQAGYDYILVDSPPVLGGMDVNVIADAMDGMIFAALPMISKRRRMRKAVEQLEPAPILGVVVLET